MIVDTQRPVTPMDGDVWMQSVEQIMTSFDMESMECQCEDSCPGGNLCTLDAKRKDSNYGDVLDSIRDRGFVRPITVWTYHQSYEPDAVPGWCIGDGHHRLAAAIDLGLGHIPVEFRRNGDVSYDSGTWHYDSPIPLFTRVTPDLDVPRF